MTAAKLKIRADLEAQFEDLAAETHRDGSELANEALVLYLEREKRDIARIREGLDQARRGEFAADDEVEAFFEKRAGPGT
jgi:predicted transcriptional regulator